MRHAGLALVAERPNGFLLSQPLESDDPAQLCTRRMLALMETVPSDATWYVAQEKGT